MNFDIFGTTFITEDTDVPECNSDIEINNKEVDDDTNYHKSSSGDSFLDNPNDFVEDHPSYE